MTLKTLRNLSFVIAASVSSIAFAQSSAGTAPVGQPTDKGAAMSGTAGSNDPATKPRSSKSSSSGSSDMSSGSSGAGMSSSSGSSGSTGTAPVGQPTDKGAAMSGTAASNDPATKPASSKKSDKKADKKAARKSTDSTSGSATSGNSTGDTSSPGASTSK